ncbi:hypothetical protein P168DRAFT_122754 [Aspergillus campestris IBT 28561]|uniref:Uncharacterized protein n=1 Tax=Aspergillus campestris (strain IBT 28561) TaxID=1392248 RepID=A0A2I1D687_ASPC2|nr:uncharacterized protein P168DRAFT_122754 [Aspergillus campestris IBT 28561]PKY05394.1 hypothetical protein P168DRAFT_122754 [Aspergillus campestris IBT 28561]
MNKKRRKRKGEYDRGGNQEMWREILTGPEIEWIPGTNRFNDTYCHQSSKRIGSQASTKRAQRGKVHRSVRRGNRCSRHVTLYLSQELFLAKRTLNSELRRADAAGMRLGRWSEESCRDSGHLGSGPVLLFNILFLLFRGRFDLSVLSPSCLFLRSPSCAPVEIPWERYKEHERLTLRKSQGTGGKD